MRRNEVKIADILKENYHQQQSKWNGSKYNKTTKFCLPMIELNITGKALTRFLKNAYLDDQQVEHDIERPIFLLFSVRNEKEKMWQEFCKILVNDPLYKSLYVMDYHVGQQNEASLIMYVFQVPKKWAADFELFKRGRYSMMSEEYKSKFPRDVYLTSGERIESKEWGILHKSATRKDLIAKEFINPPTTTVEQAIRFRREMDRWDEVWTLPVSKEEVYHWVEPELKENMKCNYHYT